MEAELSEAVGDQIDFPIPQTFLEFYLGGLTEFTPAMLKWVFLLYKNAFNLSNFGPR